MPDIIRNRTIRPSSRLESSMNYRININGISTSNVLIVNINHESKPINKSFTFRGGDIIKKKSLFFRVVDDGKRITIIWASTQPINIK